MARGNRSGEYRPVSIPAAVATGVTSGVFWEMAPTAMVALDAGWKIIGWNRAAERLFGYSAAEVVGRPYPLVPAEQRAAFERLLAAAGEPRGETPPVAQAGERLHRSGRRLQLRTAISRAGPAEQPIFIESFLDPGPPELAASASSQPRHAAEALRESQERFRAFMDNTPVAAWQADADGRIVLANPAYAWFTGYSAAEVVGKTIDELFPPEQAQAYRTRDREVLRTGQAQEWRLSFQRGDGTALTLLNCTLSGNTATGSAGGFGTGGGTVTLKNTLIAGNTASPNANNVAAMEGIPGMGERKRAEFGEIFAQEIATYLQTNARISFDG